MREVVEREIKFVSGVVSHAASSQPPSLLPPRLRGPLPAGQSLGREDK